MDEVYEEIKEAGNYVVDGVEKTLTDAANYVEDVVAPAPPVARTLDPAHPAPPPQFCARPPRSGHRRRSCSMLSALRAAICGVIVTHELWRPKCDASSGNKHCVCSAVSSTCSHACSAQRRVSLL